MNLLEANQITNHIENIIHEDTQLHKNSIDLTVNEIHKFTKAGSLDFGGNEFKAAETHIVTPQKKNKDDKYGWWNLEQGRYKCLFNEVVSGENGLSVISLHEHAKKAGLMANTALILQKSEPLSLTVDIPETGCKIKENARLATAFLINIE